MGKTVKELINNKVTFWQFTPSISPFFRTCVGIFHKNAPLAEFRWGYFRDKFLSHFTLQFCFPVHKNFHSRGISPDFLSHFTPFPIKQRGFSVGHPSFFQKHRPFFQISPYLSPKSTLPFSPFMPTFSQKRRHESSQS